LQRRQADSEMQAARARAQAAGLEVDAEVRGGSAAHEILEAARHGMDLIVIGTHGRGGIEHLLLGSVAEKVLRKAQCPVMVVPGAAHPEQGILFSRILCPTDGSAAADAAVAFAVSLARETDGVIHLLRVVEPLAVVTEFDALEAPAHDRQEEALARSTLQHAVSPEVRQWCRVREEIAFGKASERILAVAAAQAADVVVMGVRGRNALDVFTFGSTTNDVVRRVGCPVLVVHPQAVERQRSSSPAAAVEA
jgi:nucleotide-binding universal stress UspA family protein